MAILKAVVIIQGVDFLLNDHGGHGETSMIGVLKIETEVVPS